MDKLIGRYKGIVYIKRRYNDNSLAVIGETEGGESWGKLSVHLPESSDLPEDCFFVKNYGENQHWAQDALESGLFQTVSDKFPINDRVTSEIWKTIE